MLFTVNGEQVPVRFQHIQGYGEVTSVIRGKEVVSPICGQTTCTILVDGRDYAETTFCSEKDQYSRPKGRKISFARALLATPLSRSERAEAWAEFHKRFPYCEDKNVRTSGETETNPDTGLE